MPALSTPDPQKRYRSNASYLMQYVSLAFQLLAILVIALLAGMKLDGWIGLSFPLLVWLLPLLALAGILYNILKETGNKQP